MIGKWMTVARRLLKRSPAVTALIVIAGLSASQVGASVLVPVRGHAAPQAPAVPAIVRCDPASVYGYTTQNATIDLYIENVTGLYGADLRVTFDPAVARVVDQDPLAAGTQIEILHSFLDAAVWPADEACNVAALDDPVCASAGRIWYAATQFNPTPPATGSGPVARIVFHPVTAGSFLMEFSYHKLSDRGGVQIESVAQSCYVEFNEPTSIAIDRLSALADSRGVVVHWATLAEADLAGFNIYRGPETGERLRLNPALIMPTGGAGAGAVYMWLDPKPASGQLYWVESISPDGRADLFGPITPVGLQPRIALPLVSWR